MRSASEIGDVPGGAGFGLGGGAKRKENAEAESEENDGSGGEPRKPGHVQEQAAGLWKRDSLGGKNERAFGVTKFGEKGFKALNLGVGRAGAVPQIIAGDGIFFFRIVCVFFHSSPPVSGADLRERISRSCCMPR